MGLIVVVVFLASLSGATLGAVVATHFLRDRIDALARTMRELQEALEATRNALRRTG